MEGRILIIEVFYLGRPKGITVYLIEEEMSPSTLGKIIYHDNQPVVSKPNIVQAQVQHALWCITKHALHVLEHEGCLACPPAADNSNKAGIPRDSRLKIPNHGHIDSGQTALMVFK